MEPESGGYDDPHEGEKQHTAETISRDPDGNLNSKKKFKMDIRMESTHVDRQGVINAAAIAKETAMALFKTDKTLQFMQPKDNTKRFDSMSEFPLTTTEFENYFTIEETQTKKKTKISFGFTISSDFTMEQLKNMKGRYLVRFLQNNNCWMVPNKFTSLRLTNIGFFSKKHSILTWRPDMEKELEYQLKASNSNVPPFEIQKGRPRFYHQGSTSSTDALTIVTEREHGPSLSKMLCETHLNESDFGIYVPFGMTNKSIYTQIAIEQNQFQQSIQTVSVIGLPTESMDDFMASGEQRTIREAIMALKYEDSAAVLSIERTNRTEQEGKWFVICNHQKKQQTVRDFLDANLLTLYQATTHYEDYRIQFPSPKRADQRQFIDTYGAARFKDLPQIITTDSNSTTDTRAPKRIRKSTVTVDVATASVYSKRSTQTWVQVASHAKDKSKYQTPVTPTAQKQKPTPTRPATAATDDTTTLASVDTKYIDELRQEIANSQKAHEAAMAAIRLENIQRLERAEQAAIQRAAAQDQRLKNLEASMIAMDEFRTHQVDLIENFTQSQTLQAQNQARKWNHFETTLLDKVSDLLDTKFENEQMASATSTKTPERMRPKRKADEPPSPSVLAQLDEMNISAIQQDEVYPEEDSLVNSSMQSTTPTHQDKPDRATPSGTGNN